VFAIILWPIEKSMAGRPKENNFFINLLEKVNLYLKRGNILRKIGKNIMIMKGLAIR